MLLSQIANQMGVIDKINSWRCTGE